MSTRDRTELFRPMKLGCRKVSGCTWSVVPKKQKTDVVEQPGAFNHVGLTYEEPSGEPGRSSIEYSDD